MVFPLMNEIGVVFVVLVLRRRLRIISVDLLLSTLNLLIQWRQRSPARQVVRLTNVMLRVFLVRGMSRIVGRRVVVSMGWITF